MRTTKYGVGKFFYTFLYSWRSLRKIFAPLRLNLIQKTKMIFLKSPRNMKPNRSAVRVCVEFRFVLVVNGGECHGRGDGG